MIAYVAMGSSLGDRHAELVTAAATLARWGPLRASAVYETSPVGAARQPFLNAAVELDTRWRPAELLAALVDLERRHGRRRDVHWGDRSLDLDIALAFDDGAGLRIDEPGLCIPHPRIRERDFVLRPLCDLDPNLVVETERVLDLLERIPLGRRTITRILDSPLLGG